jgi:uncharacterized radical SAM protein YgiQ
MDSMVNRYTADKRVRSDDAYTPGGAGGQRPDRSVIVYSQRVREAFTAVPIVIGGIEASLRRIAHFDYWQEKVRRSILLDSHADLLVFGNGERQIVEIAHRLAAGEAPSAIRNVRGTAFLGSAAGEGWTEIDSTHLDAPGPVAEHSDPYATEPAMAAAANAAASGTEPGVTVVRFARRVALADRERSYIRLPSFEQVRDDPVLYAHASRILHMESNPGNARPLVQRHGASDVWLNPPPIPLTSGEMDGIYELPYARVPHPAYGTAKIPAYEMIRFSVTIQRGCFGGCTFCSITEHEGRIIQSRSEASVLREIETIRDTVDGFTGVISDLGGPTANMYRLACKSREIEGVSKAVVCLSWCVSNLTRPPPLIRLYRRALPASRKCLSHRRT